jgi:acyl dehydratase
MFSRGFISLLDDGLGFVRARQCILLRYILLMKTFQTLAELAACVRQEVALSDWLTITQEQVNLFAQATGDHQWIHVDPERAKDGPFGAPIAHGFLTLSLLPQFFASALHVVQTRMGVNYGLNKVRFMSPVPVGSALRAKLFLAAAEPIDNGGMQFTWDVTIEREGLDKPVCVAQSMGRSYP